MTPGERAARATERGLHEGLERFARRVLEQAAENVGVGDPSEDPSPAVALAESGRIDWYGPNACEIVFSTPYAAKQELDQRLDHPRGGGSHYLQRALTQELPRMDDLLASEIRHNLTGQGRR